MKKVLVTGACGFLGRALVAELFKQGVAVIAVDRDDSVFPAELKDNSLLKLFVCDLSCEVEKLPSMIPDRDIDCCIHLAWAGSTGDGRADYKLQLKNVGLALDMVAVCHEMNIKRFVGAGTLAQKDVLNYHPIDGAKPNPVSHYGTAKIAMQFMTKTECAKYGIEHVWCFFSNTYGVGNTTGNFVNFASKTMLAGKRAAFTAGEQMYDFVYVTDTVRAICAAADRGRPFTSYYLGSTKQRKLKEYVKIIRDVIDPKMELYFGEVPFKGIPLPDEEFDTSKLVRDTDYRPEVDFERGIVRTVEWLRTQI